MERVENFSFNDRAQFCKIIIYLNKKEEFFFVIEKVADDKTNDEEENIPWF